MESVLTTIADVVTAGIDAPFKKISIPVSVDGYDRNGWASEGQKKSFNDLIIMLFEAHGWEVKKAEVSFACPKARKDGQLLYFHPCNIEGFVRPENFLKILEILGECNMLAVQKDADGNGVVKVYADVYSIRDEALAQLFAHRQPEIMRVLLEATQEEGGLTENKVFYALTNHKVMRSDDTLYGFSCANLEYMSTVQTIFTMVAVGFLDHERTRCDNVFKITPKGITWLRNYKKTVETGAVA